MHSCGEDGVRFRSRRTVSLLFADGVVLQAPSVRDLLLGSGWGGGELLAQFGKTLDIEKSKDIILNDMRREIKVMTRF